MSQELSPGAVPAAAAPSRTVWLIAGVLGAASLAAAGSMALRKAAPPVAETAPATAAAAPAQPVPPAPTAKSTATRTAPAPQPAQQVAAAPVCRDCGTVESVRTYTRKGEASGVGAVAGGVLGAVVGNQIGKGNGRTAMTAIGAVGGGMAGHEIEKRSKSVTVHEVRIRMDDGTLRTLEQAQPPRNGERVVVEGKTLRPLPAGTQG